ncbi:MAG TPA: SBBP repeat-containing protein, partial [Pyrinomonadaceae bacterium]|nr:SBBP repeat-containing protein [Pyrinomonadaceae bacterium]
MLVPLIATLRQNAPTTTTQQASPSTPMTTEQAREAYGRVELSFEANRGQTDASVDFLARGTGYTLFLTSQEAVFAMSPRDAAEKARPDSPAKALRMKLVGANAGAGGEGVNELGGKVNYFMGNDPAAWRVNLPTYGRVRYSEVYPGIDVLYYGNQRQLEYDFVVAPGSDARSVSLEFEGADKVEIDTSGDLLLTMGEEVIRQLKPVIYQEVEGARRTVEGGYVIDAEGRVSFALGEYDAGHTLVIDPVIVYSTYLGGLNPEIARAIAVDASGHAYVTGFTRSDKFPTLNPVQSTLNGTQDVFVTKLNAEGTALVYSTYLGGSSSEEARGIAVDAEGNAYLTGLTGSTNFPLANAIQAAPNDAFVTKLNETGSALVYSTYIGGTSSEFGEAIAVDSFGNAYVAGSTFSSNFPTVNPIQASFGGFTDAFALKIKADGTAFVYATYLGGSGADIAKGIAVDASGNAYLTGDTSSDKFPTANALQAKNAGGDADSFVTKIDADGAVLVYSTFLGGSGAEDGEAIAVDAAGNAYVTGVTESIDFPTANAVQPANGGTTVLQDAYVTKLDATGSFLVYSTYLGGGGGEIGFGIKVDSSGSAYVVGATGSTNTFPVINALKCARSGGDDAFVTKFNQKGSGFIYSTYFGGNGDDSGQGIGLDSSGNAYIAGITNSTDLPVVNAFQDTFGGGFPFGDAFVTKLNDALSANPCPAPSPTPTPTPVPTPTPTPTPSTFDFSAANFNVAEGGASTIVTVTRSGDGSQPARVDYETSDTFGLLDCATVNGAASERCDYAAALGTLRFAAGEMQKSFVVFITDDVYVEGTETASLRLLNPQGATLGAQSTSSLTIVDNDTTPTTQNPIDAPPFLLRQFYVDFLHREPDTIGLQNWLTTLQGCPGGGFGLSNPQCDRVRVALGFYFSEEYSDRGYWVVRFYEGVLGLRPTYRQFTRDMQT